MPIDDQQLPQRDGVSQAGRRPPALDPASLPIDERSVADLLRFARGFAGELNYFREQKEPDGDWSAFLEGDLEAMARVLADPASSPAASDTPQLQPHVALLLTFLDLLQTARAQLNQLTRRHLEFYYREALRLAAGPPSPDRVHVLVELAAGQEQFRLPAGTLLAAGQDSQGIGLHYRTDQEMIANQARVASLKSLFLQRQLIGIREAYHNPDLVAALFPRDSQPWQGLPREQRAFMAMLCLALGTADPGGALPPYPDANQPNQPVQAALDDLDRLVAFIQTDLAMPLPVFRTLMELKQKQDGADQAWNQVNTILDSAGKRRVAGFQLDRSAPRDFEHNLLAALGLQDFSTFFNTLPEVADIYDLYRLRERPEVRDFIERDNRLSMSLDDFVTMMGIIDGIYKDWRRMYDILRSAARRKTPGQPLVSPNLRAYDPNKFDTLAGQTLGQLNFPAIVAPPGSLDGCYDQVLKLEAYFHLPIEGFATIREVNARGPAARPWEWEQVYTLLEQAFAAKALPRRRDQLRATHRVGGFDALIRLALGEPGPGDPLPDQRQFMALDPVRDARYIREQLYLEVANYTVIRSAQERNPPLDDPAWDTIYKILELAEHRKRGWQPPQAQIERLQNVYAAADATLAQVQDGPHDAVVTPRWRTFGAAPAQPDQHVVPAVTGFALASPLLALAEGDRTITLALTFDPDHFDLAALQALLKAAPPLPLRFLLSAPDGMVEITPAQADQPATIVVEAEAIQEPPRSGLLRIRLHLPAKAPPVAPLVSGSGISTPWPVLQIQLLDLPDRHELYRAFQPLALQRVDLKVEVTGLTRLTLQNDDGVLDPKKPFEPFGFAPVAGSSFAVAHPELCSKKLDALTLKFDWLGAPDNFHEYYQGYASYQNPQPNLPPSPIADNTAFQGQLRLYDNRALFDVQPIQLFQADTGTPTVGATKSNSITVDQRLAALQQSGYRQDLQPVTAEEALSWSRYWQIELLAPDFGHAVYPRAAAGYANRRTGANPDPFIVNPPYTPRIKRLALGYSASETIDLLAGADSAGKLYRIEAFGYRELAREDDGKWYLLPQYANEGELYLGIAGLTPPQNLALLFQLAEGSADPDVAREPVSWSYLDDDRWMSLEHGRLLADTTSGLLSSGMITFDLPPVAASTRLPGGLYWLRVALARNSRSIADMVAIEAQAVSAIFVDQGNAPEHLSRPMPPNSITGLVEPLPEVRAIRQPYSSVGGRASEQADHFYTRVSERLRHKNRALTSWDYERMILEAFPAIYKVKCLPAGSADDPLLADQIRIIVIPNIRGKLPFDPYEPKVSADTLAQITQYLDRHTSPDARFMVVNPTYIRLRVRLGVRLLPGYNPGYYLQALDQELQRFLSPWAYDHSAEIVFGGKINANLIVDFVERRPYVDYVAGIKLFARANEAADAQPIAPRFVVPPDAILVSDRQHQIDLISQEGYQETFFTGIGHMQIELDFEVAAQ